MRVKVPPLNTFFTRLKHSVFFEYGLVLILLSILGVVLFGRTLWLPPGNMLYGQDSHSFGFFVFDYLVRSIKSGISPWWNPYWFSGVPMLSNPATGSVYYPGNLVFFIFPISKAFVIFFLLHMVGAGTAMYRFCRRYMGRVASLTAGIVLSYSGYMIGAVYMGHTESVAVMTWLPVILGSLIRFLDTKKRKYFLIFVVSLTLQILAGTYVAVLFTLELIILYYLFVFITELFIKKERKSILMRGGWAALGIVLAFGLSAVQLVPFWENTRLSIRSEGLPYEIAAKDSFHWNLWYILVKVIDTNVKIMVDPARNIAVGSNVSFEFLFFIGYAAITVILLGLILEIFRMFRTRKKDRIWIFSILAIVLFIILAMGINMPFYRVLYEVITPYQLIRRPIRHFFIVTFFLAFFAGWGTNRIGNILPKLFKSLRFLMPILITVELLQFGRLFIRVIPEPYVLNGKEYISFLKKNIGDSRIHLNFRNAGITGVLMYEDAGSYYHLPMISGYSPIILQRYYDFVRTASLAPGAALSKIFPLELESPVINFLSARYVIEQKLRPADVDDKTIPEYFNPVYEDEVRLVFENPKAFPRFFLVGTIAAYASDEAALRVIRESKLDLSKSVLLSDADTRKVVAELRTKGASCKDASELGSVEVNELGINNTRLSVNTLCPALLVANDPYYPGWEAFVDGKQTEIYTANYAFRSIVIPPGDHQIEFVYNQRIYAYGLAISIISIFITLVTLKKFLAVKDNQRL